MNIRLLSVAALALAACRPSAPAPAPDRHAPLEGARIGGPFALVDADGRTVTDRSFGKAWRIMYFGYTFCPDVCPTDAQAIGAGLKRLAASDPAKAARIVPVFVSVDPDRDTPAVLKAFTRQFHPRMVGLTGSPAAVDRAARAYSVFHAKGEATPGGGYMVNHTRQAYLMDPDNRPVALIPSDEGPQAVADTLARWVR